MDYKAFSFCVPGEVIFEAGGIKKLSDKLREKNLKRVLLVSDHDLEKIGLLAKLEEILSAGGVEYFKYTEVEANPSTTTVEKGVEIYSQNNLEAIVCLGGGSPIDTAKGISILVTNGGSVNDYEGAHKVSKPVAPVVTIPTTAGTGSEVTPFAVITDRSKNYKMTIFSYNIIPGVAILDPELITTLPPLIAGSTGVDALVHAVEAYISLASSPFSDLMAEKAMELIGKHLRNFTANRSDIDAASGMILGSMFAGIAFSWGRLGNVHAMAHPLGGFFDLPHGIANAVLLPVVLEFNSLADKGKYEKIFNFIKDNKKVKGFTPKILVDEINQLTDELSIPKNLSKLGVKKDLIPDMAKDAMKSGNILVNPRQTTVKDVEELYERAM